MQNIKLTGQLKNLLWANKIYDEEYIDGLVQDCSSSIANALEFLQYSIKPLISYITIAPSNIRCPKSLHWRHNDNDSVSNHQLHGCLLNRLFRRRSKKTSKLRVTGLCVGNSPGPVNSPHKGPVTRKMFPFDDVIMCLGRPREIHTLYLWYSITVLTKYIGSWYKGAILFYILCIPDKPHRLTHVHIVKHIPLNMRTYFCILFVIFYI